MTQVERVRRESLRRENRLTGVHDDGAGIQGTTAPWYEKKS